MLAGLGALRSILHESELSLSKRKLPSECTDRRPTLFAHPRGSSLYLCMLFDCYVICGQFVGVPTCFFIKARARYLYINKCKITFFFENQHILPSVLYILSKNVRNCNFAGRKVTLMLSQIVRHQEKIKKDAELEGQRDWFPWP